MGRDQYGRRRIMTAEEGRHGVIFALGEAQTAVAFGDFDAERANLPKCLNHVLADVSVSIDAFGGRLSGPEADGVVL